MTGRGGIAIALALLVFAGGVRADPLVLSADPVALHPENDSVERVGMLRFLGGLRLHSPDPAFGGLSGLDISADGRTARFVSDVGGWVEATLRYDADGRLSGVVSARAGRLAGLDGKPIVRKRDADAEAMVRLDGGFAVTFERDHRIWHYRGGRDPFRSVPRPIPPPPDLKGAPANKGAEAFVVLGDGRFVVIAEDFPGGAGITYGWLRTGDRWARFDYERTGMFHPTDAAVLPDGDLLVLERRFTYVGGVASRLARVPVSALKPGAVVVGREIARLEPPLIVENFEGVAVLRDGQGRTLIYLVSDDNFNVLQRTLLLLFVLEPG